MAEHVRSKLRVDWTPPETSFLESPPDLAAPHAPSRVMDYIGSLGHFRAEGAETPKEELSALLKVSAEVEHSLLLQYLFAAYSIDPDASSESSDAQRKILDVAIQEMAHFITVQNLILAIDGPEAFHIERETISTANPFNPLPFLLEPVSKLPLAEYVLAEMPGTFPPGKESVAARVEQLKREVFEEAGLAPHRVGALYAKIYWILQPTDEPFGPVALQPDPSIGFTPGWHVKADAFTEGQTIREHQADPDEWRTSSGPDMRIHQMSDASTAVAAISSIMMQGEGVGHVEESHFYEFLETLDLFESGNVSVLPVAKNPYVGHLPPGVAGGSPITHEYVRLWANLLNLRYSALLLHIGHALTLTASGQSRASLVNRAFQSMFKVRRIMTQMNSPAMAALDANSAPTFELIHDGLPALPLARWRRQREFIEAEQKVSAELYARPEISTDAAGNILLNDLSSDLAAWKQFVDAQLQS
jgi:hypothetical protein